MSSKRAARNKTSSGRHTSAVGKTSRYFQSPLKEEVNSEDDFEMGTAAAPVVQESNKKPEEEEGDDDDDSEDDDDWEEVEGKCGKFRDFISVSLWLEANVKTLGFLSVCDSELAGPLGPVEPPEPVLPSQPVEIEIETAEVRKR